MGGRKPTLGYASRTEAVIALRGQNLPTGAIADAIGIDNKTVAALEASAARSRVTAEMHRTVVFPLDVLRPLYPHAVRRGCTVNELARRIVDTVIEDGIIDAVLDDRADEAGEIAAPPPCQPRMPAHLTRSKYVTVAVTASHCEFFDGAARRLGLSVARMLGNVVEEVIRRRLFDELARSGK